MPPPKPLSIESLQEAQDTSQRPRTSQSAISGAAFGFNNHIHNINSTMSSAASSTNVSPGANVDIFLRQQQQQQQQVGTTTTTTTVGVNSNNSRGLPQSNSRGEIFSRGAVTNSANNAASAAAATSSNSNNARSGGNIAAPIPQPPPRPSSDGVSNTNTNQSQHTLPIFRHNNTNNTNNLSPTSASSSHQRQQVQQQGSSTHSLPSLVTDSNVASPSQQSQLPQTAGSIGLPSAGNVGIAPTSAGSANNNISNANQQQQQNTATTTTTTTANSNTAPVPLDDTSWGAGFDNIMPSVVNYSNAMNQRQQQATIIDPTNNNFNDSNDSAVDDNSAAQQQQEQEQQLLLFDPNNNNNDFDQNMTSASVAVPSLRNLPAPYIVPFPSHVREVRLDVQTMRVRLVQRGFIEPESVGGMRVREGASSSLSIRSQHHNQQSSLPTSASSLHHQNQHQNIKPFSTTSSTNAMIPPRPPSSAGTTASQVAANQKFRLCVWKYYPKNGILQPPTNSRGSSAARPSSSSFISNSSNTGAAGITAYCTTPGGTLISRWNPTPSQLSQSGSSTGQKFVSPSSASAQQQQQMNTTSPPFIKLHRDVVHMSLSFLSTGDLAISSQVCASWFLLADPWVFLEHYGWVPLGPLSRAKRVCLRVSQADDDVLPDLFKAMSLSCEHLQLECVGGVPLCNADVTPRLEKLKSLELLRPSVHDLPSIVGSLCVPLTQQTNGLSEMFVENNNNSNNVGSSSSSNNNTNEYRLHCLCINRANISPFQSNNFASPLLALKASRLIIRRTITLLPSALRLLSGSQRYPQVVLDRCVVLPTTEAPRSNNGGGEEVQMIVSGIVENSSSSSSTSNLCTTSKLLSQSNNINENNSEESPHHQQHHLHPHGGCNLPCCNFYVDSDLRPIRTPVQMMSRRRLYRLLVNRGTLTMTTSDDDNTTANPNNPNLGSRGSLNSGGLGDSREGTGISSVTSSVMNTPLMNYRPPPHPQYQQQQQIQQQQQQNQPPPQFPPPGSANSVTSQNSNVSSSSLALAASGQQLQQQQQQQQYHHHIYRGGDEVARALPGNLCLQCLIWEKPCFRHSK